MIIGNKEYALIVNDKVVISIHEDDYELAVQIAKTYHDFYDGKIKIEIIKLESLGSFEEIPNRSNTLPPPGFVNLDDF